MAYTKNNNTLIEYLKQFVPYYLAKYIEWYMTPENKRMAWDDLVTCDPLYKSKTGGYKTPEFCEENWLPRADVQNGIRQYLKFFKTADMAKLYKSMMNKALGGDTKAADWVCKFAESSFFDDGQDEMDAFLAGVNIPALKSGGD